MYKLLIAFALLLSIPSAKSVVHSVSMKWQASTGKNVLYGVGRSTKSMGPYTTIATGISGLTYTDRSNLVAGTTYYYVVAAYYKSCGVKCESKYSNQVAAKIPQY